EPPHRSAAPNPLRRHAALAKIGLRAWALRRRGRRRQSLCLRRGRFVHLAWDLRHLVAGRSRQRPRHDLSHPAPGAGLGQFRLDHRHGQGRSRAPCAADLSAGRLWRAAKRGAFFWPGARHMSVEAAAPVEFDEAAARAARGTPLTRGFKAAYGAGAMADGIVAAGFGFFLLFYLTAVCGMSGTMAGMAKLIALLIDAVADPAIGLASDRLRSRFGRRMPFMALSLIPFACAFGLIFSMPA